MPRFPDPHPTSVVLRPHSITLSREDILRLERLEKHGEFKNRSATVRACILWAYNNFFVKVED